MNHDTYRKLKSKSKKQMDEWLTQFGFANYTGGIKDCEATIYRRLIDDFGFTDEMIATLKKNKGKDIGLINERYITADEMIDGLFNEGFKSVKK